MKVYYNEFDKKKCAALKALMDDGHITKGDIDDRPIQQVTAVDLEGYDRCHFFAGIGLWDYALNLAGWEEDLPVWTGSCPCQPFSCAGRQNGKKDDRHLWPEWLRLIEECKPPTIFGEQVNAAITQGWLDDVYQGLEAQDYAVGSVVLPASAVGAPHRRERLWFVGDTRCFSEGHSKTGFSGKRINSNSKRVRAKEGDGLADSSPLGDSKQDGHSAEENAREVDGNAREGKEGQKLSKQSEGTGASRDVSSKVADTNREGLQGYGGFEQESVSERRKGEERHSWETGIWIDCPDGKQRLIEPTIPLLAHGYPERVGVIHCAGDAIVPQVAAEFITAFREATK